MKPLEFNSRRLLTMFAIATLISLCGVYLAYHTAVTSSNAWIKWGNNQAWVGDSFRLLVLSVFASLLVTVSFNVGRKPEEQVYRIRLDWKNAVVASVFLLTVTALNFYYYPIYFELEVLRNTFGYLSSADLSAVKADYFGQIYRPFFAYYFYALPLWCFIILPTFLIFLSGFGEDYGVLRASIDALKTERRVAFVAVSRSDTDEMLALEEELSSLKRLSKACIHDLRMLVQRYLPVLLVVLIGFGLGNLLLTGAIKAGTNILAPIQTREAISSFAWIIVIFVALCTVLFIYLVRVFNEYRQTLSMRVDRLLDEVKRRNLNHSFWDTINDDSKVWDTREIDILPFLLSTLINRGVIHLPVLFFATLALFAFVLNGYLQAITPLSVQDFFQTYFLRPQPPSSGAP